MVTGTGFIQLLRKRRSNEITCPSTFIPRPSHSFDLNINWNVSVWLQPLRIRPNVLRRP
jgi:hypothetical protein